LRAYAGLETIVRTLTAKALPPYDWRQISVIAMSKEHATDELAGRRVEAEALNGGMIKP
jgi:hypothetical protein